MDEPRPIDEGRTEEDDHRLVSGARAGDRRALEELVARHQPWTFNLAVRMLGHPRTPRTPPRRS